MTTVSELTPGDIVVLPDADGRWGEGFEYLGPDDERPGRLLVRPLGEGGGVLSARPDLVRRPTVLGVATDSAAPVEAKTAVEVPGASEPSEPSGGEPGITAAQRRRLFALGRSLGMNTDDLRAATPAGSISRLTRAQASELIDRLDGRPDRKGSAYADQGTATGRQLGMIAHMRDLIGFSEAEFAAWLSKRFKVGSIGEIDDSRLASRVIGGLVRMHQNRAAGGCAGRGPGRRRKAVGGSETAFDGRLQ